MSNAINPEHYNRLNPQPKDVIRAWGLNFNLGRAVKGSPFQLGGLYDYLSRDRMLYGRSSSGNCYDEPLCGKP